jgi:hypothetical protein
MEKIVNFWLLFCLLMIWATFFIRNNQARIRLNFVRCRLRHNVTKIRRKMNRLPDIGQPLADVKQPTFCPKRRCRHSPDLRLTQVGNSGDITHKGVRGAGAEAACKKLAKFGWFIRGDGSKFGYMVHREFALKG